MRDCQPAPVFLNASTGMGKVRYLGADSVRLWTIVASS